MMKIFVCVTTFLLFAGTALDANAGENFSFRVGGVEVSGPVPEGYCFLEGVDVDVAQLLAASDNDSVTHLTLQNCKPDLADIDYLILKTPKKLLSANVQRETLFASLRAAFGTPEFKDAIENGGFLTQSAEGLEKTLQMEVEIGGALKPVGNDSTCSYLAGILDFEAAQVKYKLAVAACITTVANKVVSVNFYGPASGNGSIKAVMEKAKNFALTMTGTPAK